MAFPSNPTNGDTYTQNDVTYVYSGGVWTVQETALTTIVPTAVASDLIPDGNETRDLGTAENKWRDLYLSSGTLYIGDASITSNGASLTLPANTNVGSTNIAELGGGVTLYANSSSLPLIDNADGDMAFNVENNYLYIWNSGGWYAVALLNQSPNISVSANTVQFETDGTPVNITITASDPEGFGVTLGQTGTNTQIATIIQSNNVFTFTPTTNTQLGGSFTTVFTASDGVNISTAPVDFSIDFNPLPSLATRYYTSQDFTSGTSPSVWVEKNGTGFDFNLNTIISYSGPSGHNYLYHNQREKIVYSGDFWTSLQSGTSAVTYMFIARIKNNDDFSIWAHGNNNGAVYLNASKPTQNFYHGSVNGSPTSVIDNNPAVNVYNDGYADGNWHLFIVDNFTTNGWTTSTSWFSYTVDASDWWMDADIAMMAFVNRNLTAQEKTDIYNYYQPIFNLGL